MISSLALQFLIAYIPIVRPDSMSVPTLFVRDASASEFSCNSTSKRVYSTMEKIQFGRQDKGSDLTIAKQSLELLLAQKDRRIAQLASATSEAGFALDWSERSLIELNKYFVWQFVGLSDCDTFVYDKSDLILDVGTYIGEFVRKNHPNLGWAVLEEDDPIHPYFHEIGLTDGVFQVPILTAVHVFSQNLIYDNLGRADLVENQFALMISDIDKFLDSE